MTTVMHPLTGPDIRHIDLQLAGAGVPVTARLDGPPGVVWLHCALVPTTVQVARTLHTVCRATDAPVRWAGAL